MRQPDIGRKVAELRREQNLTQEQLAETCQVSTRTVQRIENGEAEPRAFTRDSLSAALGFDLGLENLHREEVWLAALHASSALVMVLIPLLLWSWKKRQSYEFDRQGRQVLNFQITLTLLLFGAGLLAVIVLPGLILVGDELGGGGVTLLTILASLTAIPFVAIGLFAFYEGIANAVRALTGRRVRYPLAIQFLNVDEPEAG